MAAKQSSLERIFILPFVLLLLCLLVTVAWVLYRSAEKAVDTISGAVLVKGAHHLRSTVRDHLSHARVTLNAIAPDLVHEPIAVSKDGSLLPSAVSAVQDRLWTALQLFPESGRRVFFCSTAGNYVGIARVDEGSFEVGLREIGKESWTVHSSAGPRQIGKTIRVESYDPRNQRWYKLAVNHDSEVWYAQPSASGDMERLITLAKPVYAKNRALLGVASAQLSLSGVSHLLKNTPVSRNGVAFIIDRSGRLVASSEASASSESGFSKVSLPAISAHSQQVRDAYVAFANHIANAAANGGRTGGQLQAFEFSSSNGKTHAAALELQENGLDWILIASAPHSDFYDEIRKSAMRNLSFGLAAMLCALLLGYLILRRALSDIRRLAAAVRNIGRGDAFQALNIERGDEIGQLAKSFQQIERSLRTDKLTSVLNRDSLIAQIDFHCSVGREVDFLRFTILFIDLDGFKQINDLYGHDEGDRVLSESAQRLQDAIRKEDAVARFGGDEFVVYLHGVGDAAIIGAICEKIRSSLEAPIHLRQGGEVRVGASIGHANFPEDGSNSDVLLRVADNRMFYDKKMRKSSLQLPLQ